MYVKSPWLAQDVALCFVDDPGYSIQLGYFVSPILTRASLEEAVLRVQEVRKHISTPLLLEPPPSTWKMGDMSMTQWLSELVQRTGCGMLLDVGHLYAHCLIEKRDLLNEIPWDLSKSLLLYLMSCIMSLLTSHEMVSNPYKNQA